MIIGFDGSRAFVKDKTGTENYSYQLLKNLSRVDTVNHYLVYIRLGSDVRLEDWPDNFKFKIINLSRFWTQLGLALRTFIDPIDVLFISAHTLPLIRRPGLKTLMSVHDLGAEYLPKLHQLKQRLYLGFITKFQLKSASKLIAVSEATKKDLIGKIGISPKKIKVIYEGIDRLIFKPVKGEVLVDTLRAFDLEKGKYFLFVGTIQPRKNLERLIRAYAEFAQSLAKYSGLKLASLKQRSPRLSIAPSLILAGSNGWLSDEIYKLPKKLGIENKVKFLGRVEDRDLPALYSGALALVFPSLFEGFGLPILEAFACNCPVLTSNLSSMKEIAGKEAVLVDPYSEESILEGLKRIKPVKNGAELVKKFSWETAAKETLGLLKELGQ